MKGIRNVSLAVLFVLLSMTGLYRASAAETAPTEQDRQVLEAVLLHLRADTNFNLTRTHTNPPTIVLHALTPEKTGFLSAGQIRSDLRTNSLPAELENDLRTRNTKPEANPGHLRSGHCELHQSDLQC